MMGCGFVLGGGNKKVVLPRAGRLEPREYFSGLFLYDHHAIQVGLGVRIFLAAHGNHVELIRIYAFRYQVVVNVLGTLLAELHVAGSASGFFVGISRNDEFAAVAGFDRLGHLIQHDLSFGADVGATDHEEYSGAGIRSFYHFFHNSRAIFSIFQCFFQSSLFGFAGSQFVLQVADPFVERGEIRHQLGSSLERLLAEAIGDTGRNRADAFSAVAAPLSVEALVEQRTAEFEVDVEVLRNAELVQDTGIESQFIARRTAVSGDTPDSRKT